VALARPSTAGVTPLRRIRKMTESDGAAVAVVLKESPEAAQWAPWDLHQALPADVQVWVAEHNGEVIGLAATRAAANEAELLNLAVRPGHRGSGWGRALMQACIEQLRAAGAESLFLEVRESNFTARAFYAALGFVPSGRRRFYYPNPPEDAVVLSLRLKSP
jgi:ribosomal-protein-alanine N-acetyltransferase